MHAQALAAGTLHELAAWQIAVGDKTNTATLHRGKVLVVPGLLFESFLLGIYNVRTRDTQNSSHLFQTLSPRIPF